MEEKIVEEGVKAVAENEQVVKAVIKSGKGKAAIIFAGGAAVGYFVNRFVVPAVKKVFAKKDKDQEVIVDAEAAEIEE